MRRLLTLLCSTLAIALTSCAVHVQDKSFLRPVAAAEIVDVADLPPGYSLATDRITTSGNHTLYRARFTHPEAKSVVLYFNGNASTLGAHALSALRELTRDWHPDVVFVDYRGYGQSSGVPSLEALSVDADLVYDVEATAAKREKKKMVVAGHSLGGVVAGGLAEAKRPDAVILVATVSNVPDMLEHAMPWYVKPFVNVSIDPKLLTVDNIRAVKAFTGPLLVIGARDDKQTPAILSRRIFEASASPAKRLRIVSNAGHNDVLRATDAKDAIRDFAVAHGL